MKSGIIKILIIGLSLVVLMLVVGYNVIEKAQNSVADLPMLGEVPEFSFVSQVNQPFGLENLKGKISVVDFMFTRCHGPCPVMSGNMADLYKGTATHLNVQYVSISVDPDHDSIPVLAEYAAGLNVNDNRWVFLRAEMDAVKELCEGGFMLAADDLPGNHSTKFILVDKAGNIRGYYDGMSEASMTILKTDIRQLVNSES